MKAAVTLCICLGDSNWTIRKHAADCLVGLGEFALHAFEAAFEEEQNIDFYFWCSRVLKRLGERAIPLLMKVLEHEDKSVRLQAARALATSEGAEVDRVLVKCLADKLWPVRNEISEILTERGESVIPLLLEEMSSGQGDIVFWGKKIIKALGARAARALLTRLADPEMGRDLLENVKQLHDPYLTAALAKYLAAKAEGDLAHRIHDLLQRSAGEAREVWDSLEADVKKKISDKSKAPPPADQTSGEPPADTRDKATTISIMDDKIEDAGSFLLEKDVNEIMKLSHHKIVPLLGRSLNLRYGIIHEMVSTHNLEAVVIVTKEWLSLDDEQQKKVKSKETWFRSHVRLASRDSSTS